MVQSTQGLKTMLSQSSSPIILWRDSISYSTSISFRPVFLMRSNPCLTMDTDVISANAVGVEIAIQMATDGLYRELYKWSWKASVVELHKLTRGHKNEYGGFGVVEVYMNLAEVNVCRHGEASRVEVGSCLQSCRQDVEMSDWRVDRSIRRCWVLLMSYGQQADLFFCRSLRSIR